MLLSLCLTLGIAFRRSLLALFHLERTLGHMAAVRLVGSPCPPRIAVLRVDGWPALLVRLQAQLSKDKAKWPRKRPLQMELVLSRVVAHVTCVAVLRDDELPTVEHQRYLAANDAPALWFG